MKHLITFENYTASISTPISKGAEIEKEKEKKEIEEIENKERLKELEDELKEEEEQVDSEKE